MSAANKAAEHRAARKMRNRFPISWIKTLRIITLFAVVGTGGGYALKAIRNVRIQYVCSLEIISYSMVVCSFVALNCHHVVPLSYSSIALRFQLVVSGSAQYPRRQGLHCIDFFWAASILICCYPPRHHGLPLPPPNWRRPYVPSSQAHVLATRPDAKFAILGGGSFGLALSHVLSRNEVRAVLEVVGMGFQECAWDLIPFTTITAILILLIISWTWITPLQVPMSILVRSKDIAKKLNAVSYLHCGVICFRLCW